MRHNRLLFDISSQGWQYLRGQQDNHGLEGTKILLRTRDRFDRPNAAVITHTVNDSFTAVEIPEIDRRLRRIGKRQAGRLIVAVKTMRSEFEVSGRTMSRSESSLLTRHMNSENDPRSCLVALPAPPAVRLVNKHPPFYPPLLSRLLRHHPPRHTATVPLPTTTTIHTTINK